MIGNTKIFVSSTCFDLDQVRADLKATLESIGHIPVLSEYKSFPVFPSLDAVENCKKVVRESSDLFVLIIGGRRGSLDPTTGKSIVNSEYETAKRYGIDRFIFVNRRVWDLLPLWEANPNADFSICVDNPEVFAFIQRIKSNEGWIFTFDRAEDIANTLRTQISVYLKDLIARKRMNKLSPLQSFAYETERAQYLALERPDYWEFMLTEELLRSKLITIRKTLSDVERGLVFRRTQVMKGKDFLTWIDSRINDLVALIKMLVMLVEEEIQTSWGEPGQPGDAEQIKSVVDRIIDGCNELVAWEIEIRSLQLPDAFNHIRELMHGWAEYLICEFERIPDELAKIFRDEPNPEGTFIIKLIFNAPPNLEEVLTTLNHMQQNVYEFVDEY
jgi:hypothetical protein